MSKTDPANSKPKLGNLKALEDTIISTAKQEWQRLMNAEDLTTVGKLTFSGSRHDFTVKIYDEKTSDQLLFTLKTGQKSKSSTNAIKNQIEVYRADSKEAFTRVANILT